MTDFYDLAPWQPKRLLLTDPFGRVYTAGLAGMGGVALSILGPPDHAACDHALSEMTLEVTEQQPEADTDDAWLALDDWQTYSGLDSVGQRGLRAEAKTYAPLDGEARVHSKDVPAFLAFGFRAVRKPDCPGQHLVLSRTTTDSPQPASARLSAVVGRAFVSEFMSGYFVARTGSPNTDANQLDVIDATLAVNQHRCVIINQGAL